MSSSELVGTGSNPVFPLKKLCRKCNVEKPVEDFHKRGSGYQPWCKPCKSDDFKQYYNNPDKHKRLRDRLNKNRDNSRSRISAEVNKLKEAPCMDCKQTFHPCAMDFDHLRDKTMSISEMVTRGWSTEEVLAEIAKCELVCSNCHRVRTFNRRSN